MAITGDGRVLTAASPAVKVRTPLVARGLGRVQFDATAALQASIPLAQRSGVAAGTAPQASIRTVEGNGRAADVRKDSTHLLDGRPVERAMAGATPTTIGTAMHTAGGVRMTVDTAGTVGLPTLQLMATSRTRVISTVRTGRPAGGGRAHHRRAVAPKQRIASGGPLLTMAARSDPTVYTPSQRATPTAQAHT